MARGFMDIPSFAERLGMRQGNPRFEELRERIKRLSEQTLDPYKTYHNQAEEKITEFSEGISQEYPDILQATSLTTEEQQAKMKAVLKYCCQHFNHYRRNDFLESFGARSDSKNMRFKNRRAASPALSTPPLTKGVTKRPTQRRVVPRITTSRRVTRSITTQGLTAVKTERISLTLSPAPSSPVPLPRSPAAQSSTPSQHLTSSPSQNLTVKEEPSEFCPTISALSSPSGTLPSVPRSGVVKLEPFKRELIKEESIKHEPSAIKHEPVKQETLVVKHELIKRETLAVKHEMIKQEPPEIKGEQVKHELPEIKGELVKHEPIKHEAIQHEINIRDTPFDSSKYSPKKEEKVATPRPI